jgi:hypothetical protein
VWPRQAKPSAEHLRVVSMQASYLPPGGLTALRTCRPTSCASLRAARQDAPRAVMERASNTAVPPPAVTFTFGHVDDAMALPENDSPRIMAMSVTACFMVDHLPW